MLKWKGQTYAGLLVVWMLAVAAVTAQQAAPAPPANVKMLTAEQQAEDDRRRIMLLEAEVLKLRLENQALRGQVAQANMQTLGGQMADMESTLLKAHDAPAGSTWDWTKMTPIPPARPAGEKPTP